MEQVVPKPTVTMSEVCRRAPTLAIGLRPSDRQVGIVGPPVTLCSKITLPSKPPMGDVLIAGYSVIGAIHQRWGTKGVCSKLRTPILKCATACIHARTCGKVIERHLLRLVVISVPRSIHLSIAKMLQVSACWRMQLISSLQPKDEPSNKKSIAGSHSTNIRVTALPLKPLAAGLAVVSLTSTAFADYALTDGASVKPLELFQECQLCPEMIVVPLGSFMMGATEDESRNPFDFFGENATNTRRAPDDVHIIPHEHPRHKVKMDVPFAMGRNEVTYGEWMQCVDAGACSHSPDHKILRLGGYTLLGPEHPVINVSFEDVQEYLSWLNSLVGADVYRLPTEAEWEYAAKAGTQTRYAQGEEVTSQQANFSGDATETTLGVERPDLTDLGLTVPVSELDAANGWGLRHMSGNVREMTQSCWSDTHLNLESSGEYLIYFQEFDACRPVLKGGSYATGIDALRPAARGRTRVTWRNDSHGFRIARKLEQ